MKSVRTANLRELAEGTVLLVDMDDGVTWKLVIGGVSKELAAKLIVTSALDPRNDDEEFIANTIIKHLQVGDPIHGLMISTSNPREIAGKITTKPVKCIEIYADTP